VTLRHQTFLGASSRDKCLYAVVAADVRRAVAHVFNTITPNFCVRRYVNRFIEITEAHEKSRHKGPRNML
jgi:hypothetical protein